MEALHISILSTSILSASLQADEIARGQTIGVGALEAGWLQSGKEPECCLLVEPQGIGTRRAGQPHRAGLAGRGLGTGHRKLLSLGRVRLRSATWCDRPVAATPVV